MKALKFILLWIAVTLVMIISWAIGSAVGNIITSSAPPMAPEGAAAAAAGIAFLEVCAFNSVLVILLVRATGNYSGKTRLLALVLFIFAVQTLLPQMETYFFASQIGITMGQVTSIVIAGMIVSTAVTLAATFLYRKLFNKPGNTQAVVIPYPTGRRQASVLAVLIIAGYAFLYITFGRLVAWQSETVRMYYTGMTDMAPFSQQLAEIFASGLYFLQLIRASIWIAVSVPVVAMLREKPAVQFLLVAVLTSLLPASLLFIPNPFMPNDVAMVHFVETSTSNLVWGLLIVWAIRSWDHR